MIAVRNLVKYKAYSFINIFGLAIGMACCMLILLHVQDELSYDRYHKKIDRIYRIVEKVLLNNVGEETPNTPFPVATTLQNDYPGMVEKIVRFFNFRSSPQTLRYGDNQYNEKNLFFADSSVFEIFSFELIEGNPRSVLAKPNAIVMTESLAKKYFANENPLGKLIHFEGKYELIVSGVMKDVPENSHFHFDGLISFLTVEEFFPDGIPTTWFWNPCYTYLLLSEDATPEMLEAQFPHFVEKYFPENIKKTTTLYLQSLADIHLRSHLGYEIEPNGDIIYVYIFSVIAVFILVIACINFMNLVTARSTKRAREVGMRKVLGAYRLQLIAQFIGETLLLSLIAVALALCLLELMLPAFNFIAGKTLTVHYAGNPILIWGLIGIVVFVGAFAGSYPAFILSAFRPARVLKGNFYSGSGSGSLRRLLVVTQFSVSLILIIGTAVAYRQLDFLRSKKLGFDKEQVVMMPVYRSSLIEKYETFKGELLRNPRVLNVTLTEEILGARNNTGAFQPEGFPEPLLLPRMMVRDDFIETFDIEVIAGRSFSEDFPTDEITALMINEAMVKHLKWKSPGDAVGKKFRAGPQDRLVIGVVKDFNFASLHQPVKPFVILDIGQSAFFNRYIAVRIAPQELENTLDFLKQKWEEYVPERSFDYFFLDDQIDQLYKTEAKLGQVAAAFSILAILIACLGLFGLVSFTAEQRTREIGIRKVLGASVSGITMLISGEFVKLILLASLIAWPVSYLLLNRWLQDFAYRIEISWWFFFLAGGLALLIAILTVSYQAIRAALANPVEALRYE
jgi:putative ABC transport system permease protein